MEIANLRLNGLKRIRPKVHRDERGLFFEAYKKSFVELPSLFIQDNLSSSKKGTIRGLHYQSDPGQAKLVSCIQGKIWDVAVDIRKDSDTFGEWEAIFLDDQDFCQLYIPVGFAHGFCVLSETATVLYKISSPYNPATECSIRWDDPDLNIPWPIRSPVLSLRDQQSPFFKEVFHGALDSRR